MRRFHLIYDQNALSIIYKKYSLSPPRTFSLVTLNSRCFASFSSTSTTTTAAFKNKRLAAIVKKVGEASKTALYFGVIVGGFTLTGAVLWSLFEELFSKNGVHSLYGNVCKKIEDDAQISAALGSPVKAYNDLHATRRHRPNTTIIKDGTSTVLKMQFHLIGSLHHAIVDAEFHQDPVTKQWLEHTILVTSPNGFTKYLVRPPPPSSFGGSPSGSHPLSWLFGRFFGPPSSSEKDAKK